jgi:hypothetical protein
MRAAINVTCDVYRAGNAPPAAPDVVGLAGQLQPLGWPASLASGSAPACTHVLTVELSADVRDDFDAGVFGGGADRVYVPDRTGTAFAVVFVERVGRGGPDDRKRVYLQRRAATWPTSDV